MKDFDLIDRYFENALTPEERIEFNHLLQNDSEFKDEFIFRRDLKKAITAQRQEDLRSTLKQLENRKENRFTMVPKKWFVAASFLVLVSLGFWTVKSTYFPSDAALYNSYFEPYRNKVMPVVRGEEVQTIEYKAFSAYESKEYHKAINLFNSVKNPSQNHLVFYKAMSYLCLDKTEEAIELLEPLTKDYSDEDPASDYSQQARWYLGLSYLKNGQKQGAISQFTLIANQPEETFKKEAAAKILSFLD